MTSSLRESQALPRVPDALGKVRFTLGKALMTKILSTKGLFAESRTPGSRQTCVVGWYITTIHATKGWEQEVGPHRGATSVQWSQRRSQSRCQCSHWGSYVSSCLLPNLSQGSKCVRGCILAFSTSTTSRFTNLSLVPPSSISREKYSGMVLLHVCEQRPMSIPNFVPSTTIHYSFQHLR
jgi:hypothetical protein